jgi:hypothetical protein
MIRLAHVIETFEADLLGQYGPSLLPGHHQALAAIKYCRSAYSPRIEAQCEACDEPLFVPHSCGHRFCPHCQAHESQRWLERQQARLVPGEYFLLTFTLPAQFRLLAKSHQGVVYPLLMTCAWQTLHTFSQNDKQLQGTPGAVAVLHTHSRRLAFHPHVHVLMPAVAFDARTRLWRTKKPGQHGKGQSGYLFNHKALAKVFRAKLLAALDAAGIPLPKDYPAQWVVDCKSVGAGEKALVYLGRYLYRGVIREQDILACKDGEVTFRYRDSKTRRMETRTLPGAEFLWLLIQHVLPKGLQRTRNFGFLHPNSKRLIALLRVVFRRVATRPPEVTRPAIKCPCCGGAMRIVRTRIVSQPPIPVSAVGQGAAV